MQRAEITTIERRRRWRLSEKQEIVAETLEPGASVSAVAQRHGMHPVIGPAILPESGL